MLKHVYNSAKAQILDFASHDSYLIALIKRQKYKGTKHYQEDPPRAEMSKVGRGKASG